MLVTEREIADYYDAAVRGGRAREARRELGASTRCWRASTTRAGWATPTCPVPPAALAELVTLVENGTLSGKLAKDVFAKMWTERRTAADIVAAEGLAQVSDGGELEAICERVIAAHPDEAARFRAATPS